VKDKSKRRERGGEKKIEREGLRRKRGETREGGGKKKRIRGVKEEVKWRERGVKEGRKRRD
jgi:hypothetical protein